MGLQTAKDMKSAVHVKVLYWDALGMPVRAGGRGGGGQRKELIF